MDPDFTIEDFSDEVALFVLGNPWLVFVAALGPKAVKGTSLQVIVGCILFLVLKQLPWAKMTMVKAVEHL